jgi:hypothetical protein
MDRMTIHYLCAEIFLLDERIARGNRRTSRCVEGSRKVFNLVFGSKMWNATICGFL